ncbi:MAG: phosphoenolpyruvate--protein phosphotransferase [Spirochaetes bacterium]|nr:phosphoenolpyruvate--protein phosphotransferase [Spirochaetota bacterium]
MKILKGLSASVGIALGKAGLYSLDDYINIPHYKIPESQIDNELKRLNNAFLLAASKLENMVDRSRDLFGEEGKSIISAHLAILNDPHIKEKIEAMIKSRHINAEHALEDVFEDYIKRLTRHGLHFEEISHDVKDVRDRLIESFSQAQGRFTCPVNKKEGIIVVSERLTPSMLLHIPRENVLAFVTHQGGYTSHATILARSMDVPVVFGIDINQIDCNADMIVDGTVGTVHVWPDKKTLDRYIKKQEQQKKRKDFCLLKRKHPVQTKEGLRINLKVNISTMGEIDLLKKYVIEEETKGIHYDGIGLLRTEFIFMRGESVPSEEEQISIYRNILQQTSGKSVIIRLLDISPDKTPAFIEAMIKGKQTSDIRGARAIAMYKDVYITQVRSILRSAVHGQVKILFPMVADIDDLYIAKNLVDEAASSLKKEGKKFSLPPLGIMFETPSSVMLADQLLREVDFANIGTNDLLQYSVAASRESLTSQESYHIMHPSVVRMIEMVTRSGRQQGKEVCLCGEVSSFEQFYPVLLDAGVISYSVPVTKYEDIKCELLHISESDYKGKMEQYLTFLRLKDQNKYFEFNDKK